ncbi:MAG TPA: hypothetical protein VFQ67_03990 [Allosphingosinicella sp.]|jgi:hypothetical protein|nr:hypothetical protein [Allosphingosinicella sp.]
MKPGSIELLVEPADIHDFVLGLWSDGPIRRSHASGGSVKRLVDRFARLPRFFFRASDHRLEWTHFSTWWGGILLCDYDNPAIRDLRYLHEIHHAATLPYIPNGNVPTFEAKAFRNEREASTATEMAVYLEFPELRPLTFDHPIFMDRFLYPDGDFGRPDARLLARWRSERDLVFQELMYERTRAILADESEVNPDDPQIIWLRRYGEQGANWVKVWSRRFQSVEDAMIRLREDGARGGRRDAARRHLDWLLSPEIAEGTDVPFRTEAAEFRAGFDALIEVYDEAMIQAHQKPVKGIGD